MTRLLNEKKEGGEGTKEELLEGVERTLSAVRIFHFAHIRPKRP